MSDILKKILTAKKEQLATEQRQTSIEALQQKTVGLPPCLDFYRTLTRANPRGINVIAEIKRASPSAGLIREDFDPVALAKTYKNCGAEAISVLTDEHFFQGRLEYIEQVKKAVDLPVIRKDFIIGHYQVYQARAAGADAILLIAEALDSSQLLELIRLANSLTMTVLLEVHEKSSLERVLKLAESSQDTFERNLLGINNRNLKTMRVDLSNSEMLGELVKNKKILVSESGIEKRADVERLIKANFNVILIGETLMRSKDIAGKFNELFGENKKNPSE